MLQSATDYSARNASGGRTYVYILSLTILAKVQSLVLQCTKYCKETSRWSKQSKMTARPVVTNVINAHFSYTYICVSRVLAVDVRNSPAWRKFTILAQQR